MVPSWRWMLAKEFHRAVIGNAVDGEDFRLPVADQGNPADRQ
jgi:hypothetical protein